jgi:hypothetical protein
MNGDGPFVSLDPSADRVSDPPVLHRKALCAPSFFLDGQDGKSVAHFEVSLFKMEHSQTQKGQ